MIIKKTIIACLLTSLSLTALADDNIHINLLTKVTPNTVGLVAQMTRSFSSHDIEIINDSDEDKSFSYNYKLCVSNHGCTDIGNHITVKAHTRWNNHRENYLDAAFNAPAHYKAHAYTQVNEKVQSAEGDIWIRY